MTADPVSVAKMDEMSLNNLVDLATRTIAGYHAWSQWLEDYYDPAKSALIDLLQQFGVIVDNPLTATCRHCGRSIVNEDDTWIDPNATGDDAMWRETCDSHDTFMADHEPTET